MAIPTPPPSAGLLERINNRILFHVRLLADPESMLGWFIVTIWAVLAGLDGQLLALVVLIAVAWFIHGLAVETGNHVMLWMATAMLLILIVLASELTFNGLGPLALAAAGSTALVHSELIRLNFARRRNATIDRSIYASSTLALGATAVIGLVGVALVEGFSAGSNRPWLWMPLAVAGILAIGYALTLIPARGSVAANRQRWEPGTRIPPQPLRSDALDHE